MLEIANFSGSTVSLNDYTLKLSSNGNANWTVTYNFNLNEEILNGDVYVVAQGSNTLCVSEEDDANNAITAFNGNDAIGLFKNDILTDILGILGDGTFYAEDITIVRNPDIAGGNLIYTPSEWTTFAQNNCDDLGSHTQTLSIDESIINQFKFYPNPVTSNRLEFNLKTSASVIIYDILGKKVLSEKINSSKNWLNIVNLNKGIYLVKMTINEQTTVKKLIRN